MIGPGREQPHPYIRTEEHAGNKEPVVSGCAWAALARTGKSSPTRNGNVAIRIAHLYEMRETRKKPLFPEPVSR